MPYNLSTDSVDKVRSILERIHNLDQGQVLFIEYKNTTQLRHLIYQGIKAAKELNVIPFNRLNIIIHMKRGGLLIKHKTPVSVDMTVLGEEETTGHFIVEQDVNEFIVVSYMSQNDISGPVTFNNFTGNMEAVRTWASNKGLVVSSESPLTIEKQRMEIE